MVECYNRMLEEYLLKAVSSSQQDWAIKMPLFLPAYQSSIHRSIGWSLVEMYGRELYLASSLLFGAHPGKRRSPVEYIAKIENQLKLIYELIET